MTEEEIREEFDKLKNKEYGDDAIRVALEKEGYVNKLSEKGSLAKEKENISNFFNMLKDNGKDGFELSKSALPIIIGTLIYVISPIDLVSDLIPFLGLLDDTAIVAAAAATGIIADEIARYKDIKNGRREKKNNIG